jgi:hypothetical protein
MMKEVVLNEMLRERRIILVAVTVRCAQSTRCGPERACLQRSIFVVSQTVRVRQERGIVNENAP